MTTAVHWFRRDLRLADNPALLDAGESADEVLGVFCLDDALLDPSGPARGAYLAACLAALNESMQGRLVVVAGNPVDVIPRLAVEVDAASVHVTEDFAPYGRRRDAAVAAAVSEAGMAFVRGDSPYAVAPGTIFNQTGGPYRVFTPYSKQWRAYGWEPAYEPPANVAWCDYPSRPIPASPDLGDVVLPPAGEAAAHERLDAFLADRVASYGEERNRPDLDRSSRLSPDLKWGVLHPRQILGRLGSTPGEATFATELCWRDFYADVLFHTPASARDVLNERMKAMTWDRDATADERFHAWTQGQTGYPIVDAGMRQLRAEKWMHNRVRMIVASFLVKDLHVDWQRGARHFMSELIDGDLASNQHGWQWTAGTGTDAAPYFRIFNPTSQGQRFDPSGDYVRRWVPELAGVAGAAVHEPWRLQGGTPAGYPDPIVDHAEEREESLRRYAATK